VVWRARAAVLGDGARGEDADVTVAACGAPILFSFCIEAVATSTCIAAAHVFVRVGAVASSCSIGTKNVSWFEYPTTI